MYKILRQSGCYIPKNLRIANICHNLNKIGDRDIVGYGRNGSLCYSDNIVYPMPAIRWKENTPEVMVFLIPFFIWNIEKQSHLKRLRKIELADWKNISLEDKKGLYRASFCQTFAEFEASDGDWKNCISGVFISVTIAIWYFIWLYKTGTKSNHSIKKKRTILLTNMLLSLWTSWYFFAGKTKSSSYSNVVANG